ncbi:hypothetical protein ACP4OV_010572 [Aristida adscensionis]
MATCDDDYDAAAALAAFHDSRAGVRGLAESGVAVVPPMFLRPATASSPASPATTSAAFLVPSVDLSLPRSDAVALVRAAASSCGFFQVTNHGVPEGTIDAAISGVRAFHEQPRAARSALYSPAPVDGAVAIAYCTIPIQPPRAGQPATLPLLPWRDSLVVRFGPAEAAAELGLDDHLRLPVVCRDALLEYHRSLARLGKEMAGLVSEALGVGAERLEQLMRVEGSVMPCQYYPPCPEPARVVGGREHTDASLFTVLAQDRVGGLQVQVDNDDDGHGGDGEWMDVPPVAGALLINIGDVLKVVSNDKFKSMKHRVVIKSTQDARVSIALFFNPSKQSESDFFRPLPELVTATRPAKYRSLTLQELRSYRREIGHAMTSVDRFKLFFE